MAFAQDEPIGGIVDDLRAGIGPATWINMNRAPPKPGEATPAPVGPLAFFPWHKDAESPPAPDTPEQTAERIRAMLNRKAKAAQKRKEEK